VVWRPSSTSGCQLGGRPVAAAPESSTTERLRSDWDGAEIHDGSGPAATSQAHATAISGGHELPPEKGGGHEATTIIGNSPDLPVRRPRNNSACGLRASPEVLPRVPREPGSPRPPRGVGAEAVHGRETRTQSRTALPVVGAAAQERHPQGGRPFRARSAGPPTSPRWRTPCRPTHFDFEADGAWSASFTEARRSRHPRRLNTLRRRRARPFDG